jgi:hypothetical protein
MEKDIIFFFPLRERKLLSFLAYLNAIDFSSSLWLCCDIYLVVRLPHLEIVPSILFHLKSIHQNNLKIFLKN